MKKTLDYRWEYNNLTNAGYLHLQPERYGEHGAVAKTISLTDQLNLDFDADGNLFGLEFIGTPTKTDKQDLTNLNQEV